MIISELIEKLKIYPPNSQILIMTKDCYYENITSNNLYKL